MPDETAPEKLELLMVNQLLMAEVRIFEKMSGFTVQELYARGHDEPMPAAALMALAYLTEKRARPSTRRDTYEQFTYQQLISHLGAAFTFETVDEEDGEGEDPT